MENNISDTGNIHITYLVFTIFFKAKNEYSSTQRSASALVDYKSINDGIKLYSCFENKI